MNLVKINKDMVIDADKLQALKAGFYHGRNYTTIYLQGNKDFLIEDDISEIHRTITQQLNPKATSNYLENIENILDYADYGDGTAYDKLVAIRDIVEKWSEEREK